MTLISDGLLILFAGQLALGAFLMFGYGTGAPLRRRAFAAFGSVGMVICVIAIIAVGDSAESVNRPPPLGAAMIGLLFLLNSSCAIKLVLFFRDPDAGNFSCLGTIGRVAGCLVVAWGVFAFFAIGIALLIGMGTGGMDFFYR